MTADDIHYLYATGGSWMHQDDWHSLALDRLSLWALSPGNVQGLLLGGLPSDSKKESKYSRDQSSMSSISLPTVVCEVRRESRHDAQEFSIRLPSHFKAFGDQELSRYWKENKLHERHNATAIRGYDNILVKLTVFKLALKVSNGIYIIYIFERRLNQVHVVYITAPQSPKTPSKPTSFDVGLEPEWTSVLEGGSLASSWQAWRRKGGKKSARL
ncbi:hypothetical protein DFH94DRAFT_848935 [Russula ochroleuca]|uniref:Uncharacterized protein n=1 Tax=Russula ochroleuca TaxID=152965 RepID=A0A9P5MPY0_9AGAM|nr:hypothetical protein DFH94DRAFT_848935 [Russula ochroleuca]